MADSFLGMVRTDKHMEQVCQMTEQHSSHKTLEAKDNKER
jgi:hypothetical protein